MEQLSAAATYTLRFINQTNRSIFLTGKAGTGKTTLLREIIATTHKNTVVVAPTGIAALNAGGVTIHSMFQLPFAAFIPDNKELPYFSESVKFENQDSLRRHFQMNNTKRSVIRNMELLVIDEVSMLRADVLDAMDFMMRKVRRNERPFGGVQVLYIGDLLQLPPVVKNEEWQMLQKYYRGMFFFHSHVVQQYPPLYIELDKIFRQTDDQFISVLNNLRNNRITSNDLQVLNQFVKPDFDVKANKGYIILTTHNAKADAINFDSLKELAGKQYTFKPEIVDDFPEKIYPVDPNLQLKVGAQIMFIKNDLSFEKQFFNGKMGIIKSLSDNEILVHFPEENKTIEVERYEWQNIRYKINENTKEIEEELLGTFTHFPIKLAWAITVHKSQGLTFDRAVLDVSRVFAPGQAYVALSRLRSLNGLILLSPLQMNGISSDEEVLHYASNKASEEILQDSLTTETKNYLFNCLITSFDFRTLIQEWRNHSFSYHQEAPKSPKTKHRDWAKTNAESMAELGDASAKFQSQLRKLFSENPVNIDFIRQRCDAAYDYFFKSLDNGVEEILLKIEEVKRIKKVKAFYDELLLLEELQIKTVLQLKKVRLLLKVISEGKEISKQNLLSDEAQHYKINKLVTITERFKTRNAALVEDDGDVSYYEPKMKKKKEPKKATIEETLELWKQNLSIHEIAKQRKLTPGTIFSHFTKLIQMEIIELSDILPEDKIADLRLAFKNFNGESLGELKDLHGEAFSWDELRLFKASLKQ
ncbi:putative helicase [Flavobacterium saliperosum S13]|uniref:Helix-turn-helix domain-containing protein n=2 Tax=Flavobacterium saliperosum TaxID=329186 RepID=A0A1G4W2X1_9FLAO|nr:helix-turn-helix domain-containing protein [Flavobacterium saliperosum]ESU26075.1 putative helicase [Flavobacterium saliperosum S13]SCX15833.1 Helix-turn-helix domain-containing protein [Flavobacterium saliperosum]